jgi:hypothetical protein
MAGMSTSGKRWAALFGIALALSLPKKVECGYPGSECVRAGTWQREVCRSYEHEPLGFYLLELWLERDIGFAYSSGESCHLPG